MAFDAIFVGGGVIGLSGAWRAAQQGLAVALIDPDPGHGATWVAAGMLAPVSEAQYGEADLVTLLVAAAAEWPAFADDLEAASGAGIGYRACGTVMVGMNTSDRALISELVAFQSSLGLDVRRATSSELRRLVPALSPAVGGGAEVPGDHRVDNRRLVGALREAGTLAGVEFIASKVRHVDTVGDRVGALTLDDGARIQSPQVVLCAGAECGSIDGLPPGALPPLRPVKGQVVRLRPPDGRPLFEHTIRGIVNGRSCYLVGRDNGSVVVGATVEERGFDRAVRAGAVHELLSDARTLVPGLDEFEIEECLAGLRPGTPDNAPFVGHSCLDGLVVATGHYRNGILLAPLTARALADLLGGRPVPKPVGPFGPARLSLGAGVT